MKSVHPPLVVLATSIPVSLFIIWWFYKKKGIQNVDQNLNEAKETKKIKIDKPRNGLTHTPKDVLSNGTSLKMSEEKCEKFSPKILSQSATDETQTISNNTSQATNSLSDTSNKRICDIDVNRTKIKATSPPVNNGIHFNDDDKQDRSSDTGPDGIQIKQFSLPIQKDRSLLSNVNQQENSMSKNLHSESHVFNNIDESSKDDSLLLLRKFESVNIAIKDVTVTETKSTSQGFQSVNNDCTLRKIATEDSESCLKTPNNCTNEINDTQNFVEVSEPLTTDNCIIDETKSPITDITQIDARLSEIRPISLNITQSKDELEQNLESTSSDSTDSSDSTSREETSSQESDVTNESIESESKKLNCTENNNFDCYTDNQTNSQIVAHNESNTKVSNEQNNNSVDVESKNNLVVEGSGDSASVTDKQNYNNSSNAFNNHENENGSKVAMCNGDNHSMSDITENGSSFFNDESQIYLEFPSEKVGLLIGKLGRNIKQLKQESGADVMVHTVPFRDDVQVLQIVGSATAVEMAASSIQKRFREVHLKEFDYANTMDLMPHNNSMLSSPVSSPPSFAYPVPEMTQLRLPDGISVEVAVSAIADCDCIFVQQYTHPTFYALANLEHAMSQCYSSPSTPALLSPVQVGLVCVAQHMDTWYRAQVIHSNEDSSEITIKFVDYGGYSTVPISTIKQIRADFITLPFQAAECYLDNIAPPLGENSYSTDSTRVLQELLKEGEFCATISRYRDDGVPYIHLYKKHANTDALVNNLLVDEGIAQWVADDSSIYNNTTTK